MPLIDPLPEKVPYEEVAATLAEAALRLSGGPARSLPLSGAALAAALYAAGYVVVREAAPRRQLTL
jgi:hypothetical protein